MLTTDEDAWVAVEVGRALPDLATDDRALSVVPTVGGAPLGVVRVRASRGVVNAHRLRVSITEACGLELVRVAVREGLLGRALSDPTPLRERLAEASRGRHHDGQARAQPHEDALLLARRALEEIGTSASRRAALPAEVAREVAIAAAALGEPVVDGGNPEDRPVVYAPDVLVPPTRNGAEPARLRRLSCATAAGLLATRARETAHRRLARPASTTDRLPILMYHRIAPDGPNETARYRVSPEALEAQLLHLRRSGYRSVRLGELQDALLRRKGLPGRAVMCTFDDGYLDFATYAWPLLRRYGYSATVFLVTEAMGQWNWWDEQYGERVALLDRSTIRRLAAEGVEFGSHTASHRPLTGLTHADVARECFRSRVLLEQVLSRSVRAIAYPYGDVDPVVRHLAGACGYVLGLTCRPGHSALHHEPLALPRVEVNGEDTLEDFARKLEPESSKW